jgi:hypothetical protein
MSFPSPVIVNGPPLVSDSSSSKSESSSTSKSLGYFQLGRNSLSMVQRPSKEDWHCSVLDQTFSVQGREQNVGTLHNFGLIRENANA